MLYFNKTNRIFISVFLAVAMNVLAQDTNDYQDDSHFSSVYWADKVQASLYGFYLLLTGQELFDEIPINFYEEKSPE